ncbi:MAG TPA: type II secretion system F family protein [Planctomicrobium sp.]|nr:type II secretion system F family protein [Planctomicrobium sp.]
MSFDAITVISFAVTFLTVYLAGMTMIRARSRVRNIADVHARSKTKRPGSFRRSLAGAIPMFPGEQDALEQDLRRAGYYSPYAAIEYLAARNLIVVMILIVGGGAAVAADPTSALPKVILIATAVAAFIGYVGPRSILYRQSSRRLGRIQKGLPDALDIIRMCLTGGLPLRHALERVAGEVECFHPEIAVELEVVRRHAEADTMQKALKEFARRMNAPDVNALASLVTQTERTGTQVANAVMDFADGIRRQYRQRAEEKASKTAIKMLFPVVLCLSPPIFILLMGPPIVQLKNFARDAHKPGGVLDHNVDSANQSITP